jgi:hypothetical protein
LIEGTVTVKVLSSRNRSEKEDRIGESQPFRERTLSVQDKIRPGGNRTRGQRLQDALPTKLTRLARKTPKM